MALFVCIVGRPTAHPADEMSTSGSTGNRQTGAAAAFVDAQLAAGHVAFPLAQLFKETGLAVEAAKKQLRRLGPRVVRVSPSQQFFLIVSPEHYSRGSPPVDWWLDDYFRWLGHPYYLALQSAASAHGEGPATLPVSTYHISHKCRLNHAVVTLRFVRASLLLIELNDPLPIV